MRKIFWPWALFAFLLVWTIRAELSPEFNSKDELQLELDAYRECMMFASATRCRMTPQDFVRYHTLKSQLNGEQYE